MKKAKDYWSSVFDEFVIKCPELEEHIVDWYPSAQMEIMVKLNDGRKYAYDWITKNTLLIYDPDENVTEVDENVTEVDDDEWRRIFSKNLSRKIRNFGMSQEALSRLTGLSVITISKYINNKATPSGANISKLAKALRCTVGELMYEYIE